MNPSTPRGTDAGTSGDLERFGGGIAHVFTVAERDGIGGLIALALPADGAGADSDGDRDGHGTGGADPVVHDCGTVCGLPFGADRGPALGRPRPRPAASGWPAGRSTASPVGHTHTGPAPYFREVPCDDDNCVFWLVIES